ncbi:MAG TPA: DUF2844 domain-containing protein [Anaeromyxobacteraceae bacterium]|nr:DUF2844 domain-containing protein [Anaeromyxobacteraceae bacterium]
MPHAVRACSLALALALLARAGPAAATLGEGEPSVDRDRQALGMARAAPAARGRLTLHELASPTVTVREFADASGTVFAIAWSGIARPDLAQLLGSYFDEWRRAAVRSPGPRRPRRVETARVVVETWGHARALHGRAWIPALLPAEASLDEIQ